MSDYNSSLPVRTEQNGDVAAKIVDGTIPSQALAVDAAGLISVKLNDGAGTAITSQVNGAQQALDVGINVAGVQIDPRQVRALTAADVVTAQQGTSPWITKDQSDGPVAPGTVASFSSLVGGQYNLVPPTLTTGQQAALQIDATGRLLVNTSASTEDQDYGTVGPNTLRTAAQIGNATGAADFNAGATGAQTLRVEANQGASASAANGWYVKPTDGTNSQSYTAAGEAKVSVTQPLPAGTNLIGEVKSRTEDGSGTGINSQALSGSQWLDVTNPAIAATGAAVPAYGQVIAGSNGGTTKDVAVDSNGHVLSNIYDSTGTAFSGTNPLPVTVTSVSLGTEVNDYKTVAALAANATDNHDYTITATKTFKGRMFWASGSGKIKAEVRISPDGTNFFTKWVGFNSTSSPNIEINLDNLTVSETGSGSKIRIIITNRDNQAQDVYSTISGTEV